VPMYHVLKISSPPEMALMKIYASFPPRDGRPWGYPFFYAGITRLYIKKIHQKSNC